LKNNTDLLNSPIGIFDSGLGGLTVASAVRSRLPNENIIYLGDTARVPYGDKSPETVARFACEDALFLVDQGAKLIVVACNTVASTAMPALRSRFADACLNIPIVGVLEAGVEAALASGAANLAVLGTTATIASGAYEREIRARRSSVTVTSVACPLFVPIVEEGLAEHEIAKTAFDIYLRDIRKNPPEALLLGCTHYPLLIDALAEYLPNSVAIIDSAHAVAELASRRLEELTLSTIADTLGTESFFSTDSPAEFADHAARFLGRNVESANLAVVDGHAA
jgi:glutamate racemase